MPLSDLVPYENNPRINDHAVDAVASSIREFGFKVPIIVDKENVIVAGHTRLKAALRLGLDTVPVIIADDLTPEQVKAFRLADNKTAEMAYFDIGKLQIELAGILNCYQLNWKN
jgi:ParB/RepB/Spo0J family partition protein